MLENVYNSKKRLRKCRHVHVFFFVSGSPFAFGISRRDLTIPKADPEGDFWPREGSYTPKNGPRGAGMLVYP